jgi:hypothetical protein
MAFAFYAKKFDPEFPLADNDISMSNSLMRAFNYTDKELADMYAMKIEQELQVKLQLQDEMIREQKRDIEHFKHEVSIEYDDEEQEMAELERMMQYEERQRCAECWKDEWYDSDDEDEDEQEYTKREIMNARAVLTAKGIKF